MPRRSLVAGALLVAAPVLLAACGSGSAGTITVGDAVPVAAHVALPTAQVQVGPGAVHRVVQRAGYRLTIRVAPNRAARQNRIVVAVTRDGMPVTGARVTLAASMLTMDMGIVRYELAGDGTYSVRTPAWLMPGLWELAVRVRPPGGPVVSVGLVDRMRA